MARVLIRLAHNIAWLGLSVRHIRCIRRKQKRPEIGLYSYLRLILINLTIKIP